MALVVLLGLVAWRTGLVAQLREPAQVAKRLVELGGWGFLAFIAAYMLLQPFGVPGTAFIIAAPLIWPWPVAFALSMAGTMAASVLGFSFARLVGRDWVTSLIPARFHAYDEALAKHGFVTVFVLRLVLWMPPWLHALFGVSRVGFWAHFWGSLFGYVLPILFVSYFGQRAFDWLRALPASARIVLWVAVVLAGFVAWAVRRHRAR